MVSCDEETMNASALAEDRFQSLGTHALKGFSQPVPVFEFIGATAGTDSTNSCWQMPQPKTIAEQFDKYNPFEKTLLLAANVLGQYFHLEWLEKLFRQQFETLPSDWKSRLHCVLYDHLRRAPRPNGTGVNEQPVNSCDRIWLLRVLECATCAQSGAVHEFSKHHSPDNHRDGHQLFRFDREPYEVIRGLQFEAHRRGNVLNFLLNTITEMHSI